MSHPLRNMHREAVIVSLYKEGRTLQEVGDAFGVSRERIRQILRRAGVPQTAGGISRRTTVRRNARKAERTIERDARTQEFYGCYHDEAVALNGGIKISEPGSNAHVYLRQRQNAANRNIEWSMTFPEWMAVWIDSGHFEERGLGRDRYVMGRINDRGPYEIGNVYITTNAQNVADYQADLKVRGELCEDGYRRLPERACTHSAPVPQPPVNQPAIEPAEREHTRLQPNDDGHVRRGGTD